MLPWANMKSLIALSLIVSSAAFAAKPVHTAEKCDNDAHYPEITKAELKELTVQAEKNEAAIIDVNSKDTFTAENSVTNSFNYAAHKADFAKMLPANKDAPIVAYCGGPKCQAWKKAAKEACKLGYTNVKHYKDGLQGWKTN